MRATQKEFQNKRCLVILDLDHKSKENTAKVKNFRVQLCK